VIWQLFNYEHKTVIKASHWMTVIFVYNYCFPTFSYKATHVPVSFPT